MASNLLSDHLQLLKKIVDNNFWLQVKKHDVGFFSHTSIHPVIAQIRAIINNPAKDDEIKLTEINAIKVSEKENKYVKNLLEYGKSVDGLKDLKDFVRIINNKELNKVLLEIPQQDLSRKK